MWVHTCHCSCVEVRGQLLGVRSLFHCVVWFLPCYIIHTATLPTSFWSDKSSYLCLHISLLECCDCRRISHIRLFLWVLGTELRLPDLHSRHSKPSHPALLLYHKMCTGFCMMWALNHLGCPSAFSLFICLQKHM